MRRADVIRSVPLFAHCSRRQIAEIARIADERTYGAGEDLIRQGDQGEFFYVLLEGTADVFRDGEKVHTHAAGAFFGEVALVGHVARNATVRTSSPVRALVIAGRRFRALLGRQPQVQLGVLEALAERV